jgi:hypothetical protein
METRAFGDRAAGGIAGPLLFAKLIGTGKVGDAALAFTIGAVLMIAAGIVAVIFGVNAERRSLEDIAQPLSAEEAARGSGHAQRATARAASAGLLPDHPRPRWLEQLV